MSGRPKKFDEIQALEQAMQLFWEKGYDCTGISDLESTLGIGRQSIYNTFGDKRSLFLKAFNHYAKTRRSTMLALIRKDGNPFEKIDRFLTALINVQCQDQRSGCLIANSVSSSLQKDHDVSAIVKQSLKSLHQEISKALTDAISDTKNRNTTAWIIVNTAQGLCILSKSGQSKNILTGIKKQTLSMIFPQDP